jgi:hypothetical protein
MQIRIQLCISIEIRIEEAKPMLIRIEVKMDPDRP